MDIFKGFPDEESIVNYTLNQAYQDNVTVFASTVLPRLSLSPWQLFPSGGRTASWSPGASGPRLALP